MAHVQLRGDAHGGLTLVIDGHDVSSEALTDGFTICYREPENPESGLALSVKFEVDSIDVDVDAELVKPAV